MARGSSGYAAYKVCVDGVVWSDYLGNSVFNHTNALALTDALRTEGYYENIVVIPA